MRLAAGLVLLALAAGLAEAEVVSLTFELGAPRSTYKYTDLTAGDNASRLRLDMDGALEGSSYEGGDKNGIVSASEVRAYADFAVAKPPQGLNNPGSPSMDGRGADLDRLWSVFFFGAEGPVFSGKAMQREYTYRQEFPVPELDQHVVEFDQGLGARPEQLGVWVFVNAAPGWRLQPAGFQPANLTGHAENGSLAMQTREWNGFIAEGAIRVRIEPVPRTPGLEPLALLAGVCGAALLSRRRA